MTHKLIALITALVLTTSCVFAQLTVSGVYYDPIQAESEKSIHSPFVCSKLYI